jgi:peptidoglycan/LPS O-acetylase OafA/YrhL
MSSARRVTIWLVLMTLGVWIGWDIYAAIVGGTPATESGVVRDASNSFEALAFGGGAVAGHWWVNREKPIIEHWSRYLILGALGIVAIVVSLLTNAPTSSYFGVGVASGHFLWPMERKNP